MEKRTILEVARAGCEWLSNDSRRCVQGGGDVYAERRGCVLSRLGVFAGRIQGRIYNFFIKNVQKLVYVRKKV